MNLQRSITLTANVKIPPMGRDPEFALDFGFPEVASRPLTHAPETTAQDARIARGNRSAEFRAQWHAEREVRS